LVERLIVKNLVRGLTKVREAVSRVLMGCIQLVLVRYRAGGEL